ncbi:nucleotidyltransferase family protein [Nocardioides sp. BP30]|uniref:nucleotidyltransferase family protein n=1 Tax=Nocardioides sp. BP30 TaxID=3036374 RepID=UPI002468520A|nr:nucleotidyltransferase family protein [Nocardioides sp. BP30]WGL52632.1 nucleotidyltransferase family protein [Nocardioides sp. BP30]
MAGSITGLLLAAGEGRRFGMPKALVPGALERAVGVLRDGGCDTVTVVLGAAYDEALPLVPAGVAVVRATDWAEGMGASLRAGLAAIVGDAALVHLVDLPDVGADVVRRVAGHASTDALARASYRGRPGHPVLLGRAHWPGVIASAVGDRGARAYLRHHPVLDVPCDDLASGEDVDVPR